MLPSDGTLRTRQRHCGKDSPFGIAVANRRSGGKPILRGQADSHPVLAGVLVPPTGGRKLQARIDERRNGLASTTG